MTEASTIPRVAEASAWSRPAVLHTLWAAWQASIPTALLATIAAHVTPHVQGIGFHPELRLAVVVPTSMAAAVVATVFYQVWAQRYQRPRAVLLAALLVLAAVLLSVAAADGSGLAAFAISPVVAAVAALVWFVPRALAASGFHWRTLAVSTFGMLELVGAVTAATSERPLQDAPADIGIGAQPRFLTLASGARVHYVDEGQGPTLLFLHGNPAWSFQWRELIRTLRSSFRCVALDYPGFGLSAGPRGYGYTPREQSLVVEELVSRLGLRDVTLVMQDWGGPIGLGFAGRRPELVRGVVLGSTWAWPTSTNEPRGMFSLVAGGAIGEFAQMNWNGFASLGLQHGVMHSLPRHTLAHYLAPFRALPGRGIAAFYPREILAAREYFREVEAGLGRLSDKPALIFWAGLDEGFPAADLARLEQVFPKHETVLLPSANHFFFEDEAERMVDRIRAHVH